jgi:hypothetical protein
VDEFQSFANESFADILSEARKYKLNLTIAHQYIEQMSEEVRAAVFGNVGTMITFRVGAFDAEVLEKEFAPQFTAEDLVNLGFAQIYLKLMINGVSSMPFSATTMPPIKEPETSFRNEVIDMSRHQFAMKRAEVEQDVLDWHKDKGVAPKKYEKTEMTAPEKAIVSPKPQVSETRKPEGRKEAPPPTPPPTRTFDRPKYVRRENPPPVKPAMPKLDELNDDFVPLKELKVKPVPVNNVSNVNANNVNNNVKKAVNQKSLSELRAVLQSFTKDKKNDKVVNQVESNKPADNKPEKPKEIPEDKLRQMLQVDKNNK